MNPFSFSMTSTLHLYRASKSILFFCMLFTCTPFLQAQDSLYAGETINEKLFGTNLEIGYVQENSEMLGGGILFKTSLEYRVHRVRNAFIRFNYDDYDVTYQLETTSGLADEISGSAAFSDLLLGAGYRGGNRTIRWTGLVQGGVKFYTVPIVEEANGQLSLTQEGHNIFTARASAGLEYYFDNTFALAFDIFHSRVFREKDYWTGRQGAWGISIGLIGSFI